MSVTCSTPVGRSPVPGVPALGRLLLGRVDELADEIVERVLDGAQPVGPFAQEVRLACRHGLDIGLRQMAGGLAEGVDRFALTREAARRHARRGLPVEAALRTQRISGQVVWHALLDSAREIALGGEVDLDAVFAAASDVWADVDQHASVFVGEFHREQRRLEASGAARVREVLADLLSGRRSDDAWLEQAAAALGVEVGAPALVVVALPSAQPGRAVLEDVRHREAESALSDPREALAARGLTSTWAAVDGLQIGLVPVPDGHNVVPELVLAALGPHARGRGGLSPVVRGLAQVPRARRWAEAAARALPAQACDVVALDDCLPEALLVSSPDLAGLVVERAIGGLLVLPLADREALLQTLGALVRAEWSPTRAAAALFCHRNTVLYRQQRIESVTGQDLSCPRARMLLALALMALDQGATAASGPALRAL